MKTPFLLPALVLLVACRGSQSIEPLPVAPSRTPVAASGEERPVTTPAVPQRRGAPSSSQNAFGVAKPWIDDALQIRDVAKRDAAVAAVRVALQSSDPMQVHAGLIAFNQMRSLTIEKQPFRALVLPHLTAKEGAVRVAAMYALDAAGREAGDLERVLSATVDIEGESRSQLVHVIAMFSGGELTGPAGEAVSRLISSDDRRDVRQSFSGLWGTHVSPEIEKRLLDMSNGTDPENAHDAIYFGLSTLREKSEAVVDRLVAALSDPDHNNSGRALWGLGQGVPVALQPKVADAMLQLFEARSDPTTRDGTLRLLSRYGTERHATALETLAANTAVDDRLRSTLLAVVVEIKRRTPK